MIYVLYGFEELREEDGEAQGQSLVRARDIAHAQSWRLTIYTPALNMHGLLY